MNVDFIVGKIYSVYCEDFVTYVKATIYPGEFLNVIIGPNGSGKSTLVAAIVLGLGGNPKLLSRSSNIDDYIKNGKDKAKIEIKIYKNTSKDIISFVRSFDNRGKSFYEVDKINVSHKEYLANIAKFNIQINNLCQFLPQDRVQDFAKMNPQEILSNTLSSVCQETIMEDFEKLKKIRDQQNDSTKYLKENLDKLKELESRNAQLKEQIDRMNERKKIQKEINICEIKKIWLEYEKMHNTVELTKTDLDQAQSIFKQHQNNYDKTKLSAQKILKQKNLMNESIKNEESKLNEISNEINQLQNESERNETAISEAKLRLERKKTEICEREREFKKETVLLSGLVADLKRILNNLGTEDDRKNKTEELDRKMLELKTEHKKLMDQHRNINRKLDEEYTPELQAIKKKIASLENLGDRKLMNLRDNFEHVYKATNWLRQNRHLFDGQVYEPMVLELNIDNNHNAKYIENVVNTKDLLAFTCEEKSDMNKLIKYLCNDLSLQINVIHSDANENCQFESDYDIENFRHLGFTSYLVNMLSGPAPILNYLCKVYNIHNILAGTEEVDNNTEKIPNQFRLYFAGNNKITILYSKYTGDKSSMRTEISEKKLLSVGVDAKEINNLKNKLTEISKNSDVLKNRRGDIEIKLNSLEEQKKEIFIEKKELRKRIILVEQEKEKIKDQKMKIQRLQNEPTNIEEEETNFKNFAKNIVNKSLELEEKKVKCLINYQKISEQYNLIYTKLQIYKKETCNVEQKISELKEIFDKSKKMVDTIQATLEKLQLKVDKIKNNIRERSNGRIPTDKNFPYIKEFSELPGDLDELNDFILEMQTKVNCMIAENQSIYDEYQEHETQINELRSEIISNTNNTQKIVNKMEEIHNHWISQVLLIIETINSSFGKFMSSMEYVGEIQLCRTDEFDYNSYGIQILVKYRNDAKLQALDRFVQSGGERAVAIAVYTLSLQRITHVPFRCVDEINQGMDSNNERKIFDMLVGETSQPGHSQYFFITPKLLPNLSYNQYMTIHIVYNASFIDNEKVFLNYNKR